MPLSPSLVCVTPSEGFIARKPSRPSMASELARGRKAEPQQGSSSDNWQGRPGGGWVSSKHVSVSQAISWGHPVKTGSERPLHEQTHTWRMARRISSGKGPPSLPQPWGPVPSLRNGQWVDNKSKTDSGPQDPVA